MRPQTSLKDGQTSLRRGQTSLSSLSSGGGVLRLDFSRVTASQYFPLIF